ncbi:hypothetical protein BpHYR1_054260, partial [Brachionus plicatilis]
GNFSKGENKKGEKFTRGKNKGGEKKRGKIYGGIFTGGKFRRGKFIKYLPIYLSLNSKSRFETAISENEFKQGKEMSKIDPIKDIYQFPSVF